MSTSRKLLIGGGIIALLLVFSSKAQAAASTIFNTLVSLFDTDQIEMMYRAYNALVAVGFAGVSLKLALAQVMYETGVFETTSDVADLDNNLSGIMWINSPDVQINATQGQLMPDNPGYYYAHFASIADWANDYKRIVNDPPYFPIEQAGDPGTFALLLSENGYYTGNESIYAAGLLKYWNILSSVGL